jgi:ribose transport system permease protein
VNRAAILDRPAQSVAGGILQVITRFQGYLGLVIVFAVGGAFSPTRRGVNLFLDLPNQANILRDVAENGIIAVGMTLVLLVGEIDLSVGSVLALIGTFTAFTLTQWGWGTAPALIAAIGAGIAVGLLNGTVTTRLRIPSFVVTLAMLSFARGLARLLFGGIAIPIFPAQGTAPQAIFFLSERILGVPVPAIIMVVVAIMIGLMLRYSVFGRHIYATGGNPVAARLSGVRGSIASVLQGRLGASYVYPTGAAEAIDWAYRMLVKGEKPGNKKIVLGTEEITAANAKQMCEKYTCQAK